MDPEEPKYNEDLANLKTLKDFHLYFIGDLKVEQYHGKAIYKSHDWITIHGRGDLYNRMKASWEYSVKQSTISMLKDGTVAQAVRALV